MSTGAGDSVAERRARIARLVRAAKRIGYGALLGAIVAFAVAIALELPAWAVTATIALLVVAIVVLPIPIVVGYGIRAAERDERSAAMRTNDNSGRADKDT